MLTQEIFSGINSAIRFTIVAAVIITVFAVNLTAAEIYHLDNGMEVVLKEVHSSPMVSSMVFVKSGSKYESEFENGITHFLEHLLFDGTSNISRENLDGSIRDRGGYINAFTRKELTAYLVLMPNKHIEYGMTIQADMLFNSLIPEEELLKERKVVVAEINRSADSPGAVAEDFFLSKAYAGTPYRRPVLGYKEFIENIPRAAVVDYWKRYYVPSRMTLMVIGDFEAESMKKTIDRVFGRVPADPVENLTDTTTESSSSGSMSHRRLAGIKPDRTHLEGARRFDTVANVTSTHINFSIEAPVHTDSAYLPFNLLSQYLNNNEASPLVRSLTTGENPPATEVGVGLVTYDKSSRLEISVLTDQPENADQIVDSVLSLLMNLSKTTADQEVIDGLKTSTKTEQIYNAEKLHYYGFMIAPMIFTTGIEFAENYSNLLDSVQWSSCQQTATNWLDEPNYVVTVVKPADSTQLPYVPTTVSAADVIAHFDSVTIPDHTADTGYTIEYPTSDSSHFEFADNADYHTEVLANGMTVIVKSSPDSKVFAMSVLGKDRTVGEPTGMAGITDFVNHCLEKGTVTRTASQLARDLAQIGAKVTLYDNPWIPYDDRYTTRLFSFMKFETIDEFAKTGFFLFSEMLLNPSFDSTEIENVRRSLLGSLRRNVSSPGKVARNLSYVNLFGDTPFARPITGTVASIESPTGADLREHHSRHYAPENLILAVATSHPVSDVMGWIDNQFGRLIGSDISKTVAAAPEPIFEIREKHTELESEQVSIFLSGSLPPANSDEAVALTLAGSILSHQLYLTLREKQGLAYSVGASTRFSRDFGWYYCSIGTNPENYQKAIDGIILQMEKLRYDGPSQTELDRARNRLWGRLMSAKLSRINQAYYLALDAYFDRSPKYDTILLEQLSGVTPDDIRRVASRYFRTDAYCLSTAGKKLAVDTE